MSMFGLNPNELFGNVIRSAMNFSGGDKIPIRKRLGVSTESASRYPIDILQENSEVSKAIQFTAKEYHWVSSKTVTNSDPLGGAVNGVVQWNCFLPIPPKISEDDELEYQNFKGWGLGQTIAKTPAAIKEITNAFNDPSTDSVFKAANAVSGALVPAALKTAWDFAEKNLGDDVMPSARRSLASGATINPLASTIYKESKLRTYTFEFILVAREKKESDIINSIIRRFQYYARPEASEWTPDIGDFSKPLQEAGVVVTCLKHPSVWDIKFVGNGTDDNSDIQTYLPTIKSCVLQKVSVSYQGASDNVRFFRTSGAPVFYAIQLSFQEMYIQTKQDIKLPKMILEK